MATQGVDAEGCVPHAYAVHHEHRPTAVDDAGRFTRLEVFADDDLPAARARYEELRGPS